MTFDGIKPMLMFERVRRQVTYVGPHEAVDITEDTLSKADVYAQPGGGGM